MFDGEAFGRAVVEAVQNSLAPMQARIAELEKALAERNSVASAHIDRDGALVLTYSNGTEKNLGVVCKEGEPGKDGKDGLDLSAFDVQLADDGRTLTFSLEDETRKAAASFKLPTMIYKGVYAEGRAYEEHDTVTHNGSLFVALEDTTEKPGTAAWKLAAKRGRDGRHS